MTRFDTPPTLTAVGQFLPTPDPDMLAAMLLRDAFNRRFPRLLMHWIGTPFEEFERVCYHDLTEAIS